MKGTCTDCGKAQNCKSFDDLRKSGLPLHYISCQNWQTAMDRPITNGDRVRSMTEDQLVDLLDGDPCKVCAYSGISCAGQSCQDGHLAWLKQEVPDVSRH